MHNVGRFFPKKKGEGEDEGYGAGDSAGSSAGKKIRFLISVKPFARSGHVKRAWIGSQEGLGILLFNPLTE